MKICHLDVVIYLELRIQSFAFFQCHFMKYELQRESVGFPGGAVVKHPPASAGDAKDVGLIPGSGRSPGVGNGNPLQYSCLENSMDRGAWWATVHGAAKSWT